MPVHKENMADRRRDCADSATGWMCDYICQMVFWIGRLVSSQQHDPSTG